MTTQNPTGTAFVEPLSYTLARTNDVAGAPQWRADVPGLPIGAPWSGCNDLPADIVTGGDAHAFMQAVVPGARYAPQNRKRTRKYRGAYPMRICELFTAGNLAVVTVNAGYRYSLPLGGLRMEPRMGDDVTAFERTDTNGGTYQPDTGVTGETLAPDQFAAIDAINAAARVDLPSPRDTAAATAARFTVVRLRGRPLNCWSVRKPGGALSCNFTGRDAATGFARDLNRDPRDPESTLARTPCECSAREPGCGNCERPLADCNADPCSMTYPVCLNCAHDLPAAEPAPEVKQFGGTIDLTPTWRQAAAVIEVGLVDGTPEGKRIAREELQRMAGIADSAVPVIEAARALLDTMETPRTRKASLAWDALRAALGESN